MTPLLTVLVWLVHFAEPSFRAPVPLMGLRAEKSPWEQLLQDWTAVQQAKQDASRILAKADREIEKFEALARQLRKDGQAEQADQCDRLVTATKQLRATMKQAAESQVRPPILLDRR